MQSAGVAELKARLSEYLQRVKAGEEVLVTDRGKPGARLVPVGAGGGARLDDTVERARLRTMEREGLIRLGSGGMPERFFEKERPADPGGLLRKAVLGEREEGP